MSVDMKKLASKTGVNSPIMDKFARKTLPNRASIPHMHISFPEEAGGDKPAPTAGEDALQPTTDETTKPKSLKKKQKAEGGGGTRPETMSFRLSAEDCSFIKAIAEKSKWSTSNLLGQIVEEWIEKKKSGKGGRD